MSVFLRSLLFYTHHYTSQIYLSLHAGELHFYCCVYSIPLYEYISVIHFTVDVYLDCSQADSLSYVILKMRSPRNHDTGSSVFLNGIL